MTSGTRGGTVIDNKYRLDEQIGHGGMGAVYMGTQLMVDRTVAIKLLHPSVAAHSNVQARFEVEAKAIGRLNHPNCITLYDFGYSTELKAFYTVVEYVKGESLDSLIGTDLSLAATVAIIRQIASALDHAHHHGVLHRDLKPENIMVSEMTDGSQIVKVLDFGIAQIMKGPADGNGEDGDFEVERLTRVGEVFGTPPYMSPEQARAVRDLTPAVDIYSLGIIFYELVEGRLPFFADNPLDVMLMHISEAPPPFSRPEIPEEVAALVFSMLEKDPKDRPQAGKAIVNAIDAIPKAVLEAADAMALPRGRRRPGAPEPQGAGDQEPAPGVSGGVEQGSRREPTLAHLPPSGPDPAGPSQKHVPTQLHIETAGVETSDEWEPQSTYVLTDVADLALPANQPSALADLPTPVPSAFPDDGEEEWTSRPTATTAPALEKPAQKRPPLVLWGAIGLGILVVAIAAVFMMGRSSSPDEPSKDLPASVVAPSYEESPLEEELPTAVLDETVQDEDDPVVADDSARPAEEISESPSPTLIEEAVEVDPQPAQVVQQRPSRTTRKRPSSEQTKRDRPVKLDLGLGSDDGEGRRPAKLDL